MRTHRQRRPAFTATLTAALLFTALFLVGCGGAPAGDPPDQTGGQARASAQPATSPEHGRSVDRAERSQRQVYVAVGASETVGVGADRPQQSWPSVLHRQALSDARYVNVGVSGSTAGEALSEQLPRALAATPDVVTVWLAVNDITHLVPVPAYEQQLHTIVQTLSNGGKTRVLVGNVPPIDRLPAYLACLPGAPAGSPSCELPVVPPPAQVRAVVGQYNAAIDRVVQAEGATLVDLSQGQDLTRLTASDGFHPSTEGHRVVAAAFAHALANGGR